jgi:hypothetical protein
MIRSQHENRKPFAPNSLKIPTRQHRCNKAPSGGVFPKNWKCFRDSVTDNFRVISQKDFRVVT